VESPGLQKLCRYRGLGVTGLRDLTMLSTIARILIGAAVGILLLVAVAFAFAGDLLSSPPKVQRARLPRRSLNPNVENIAAFVDEVSRFDEVRR